MFNFLSEKFSGVLSWLKDKGRLTQENINDAINQVRTALLDADVPYDIVESFLQEVQKEVLGQKVQTALNPGQHFIKIVHDKVLDFLGGKNTVSPLSFQFPSIIMVMGLQGSGKTTTIAKLAHLVLEQAKKKGKLRKILLASVDYYRPAAIEQLEILADKIGAHFYKAKQTDPVKAALEIADYFKEHSYELLFLDTAGRLHVDDTLMQELATINAKLTPKYKYLVLDAMTGQESLNVAKAFNNAIGFDHAILTKLDSDARGGAAFGFRYALKKPIMFVGVGEKIEDLEPFIPERMTSRILGMGDIMTLIEKATEHIPVSEEESLTKNLLKGSFTLKDFAEQMSMVDRFGSLQKITNYLPGANKLSPEMIEKSQTEIKRFRAIISSMTLKEKLVPEVIDTSRKKRIAQGSGVAIQDVNQLLQRYEQAKEFMKMFKKGGLFKKLFR